VTSSWFIIPQILLLLHSHTHTHTHTSASTLRDTQGSHARASCDVCLIGRCIVPADCYVIVMAQCCNFQTFHF